MENVNKNNQNEEVFISSFPISNGMILTIVSALKTNRYQYWSFHKYKPYGNSFSLHKFDKNDLFAKMSDCGSKPM